jgi:transketolase
MSPRSLDLAQRARLRTVEMCHEAKAAHIASSLSVIDILAVLYADIASISPNATNSPDRDLVIISKGHAAAGTYAILAEAGFFSVELLRGYGIDGSSLGGHVSSGVPGVELSTGSLGHGLPFGAGAALAAKLDSNARRIFVVMSDGECDEGSTWEAALFAAHHELANLTVLIDRNGIQSLDRTETVLRLEPLADKWQSFGWAVSVVDGHDHEELAQGLAQSIDASRQPTVLICETVKGRGVSFMEDTVVWHYRPPSSEDAELAMREIESGLR